MEKNPIIIMAAIEIEANFLINKLENLKTQIIDGYNFFEGTIKNYPVVVCRCNVMTINAALATYIAIQKYHPIAIISQGTAGAHSKNIHQGDIVIGEKCINIASFKSPHKPESYGSNSLDWELLSFFCGENDRLEYQYGAPNLIKLCKTIAYKNGEIHFGTIGSGDGWNRETDRILWFNKNYGTLCEDMESIAIYQVANTFNVPTIGIRIISNNEILGEVYDRNTGLKSQEFAYELVLKIIE